MVYDFELEGTEPVWRLMAREGGLSYKEVLTECGGMHL